MNDKLFSSVKGYAQEFGYENMQDFIRETIRSKVFNEIKLNPKEIELAEKLDTLAKKHNLFASMDDIKKNH